MCLFDDMEVPPKVLSADDAQNINFIIIIIIIIIIMIMTMLKW